MRRLIECIKERTILNAPGYRTKTGPNGTTLAIEPGKRSSSQAAKTPGRFDYAISTTEEEGRQIEFTNTWYDIAGRTLDLPALATRTFDLPDGEVLFALEVDATSRRGDARIVVMFGGVAELADEQMDRDRYVVPLLLFNDGTLACDFRIGPNTASMGEISL